MASMVSCIGGVLMRASTPPGSFCDAAPASTVAGAAPVSGAGAVSSAANARVQQSMHAMEANLIVMTGPIPMVYVGIPSAVSVAPGAH